MEFANIALADIDCADQTFLVTYRPDVPSLQRSIAAVGVTTPVHLRRTHAQQPWQIVCGFNRLRICLQLGLTPVPALLYSATELTDQQAFLLAVHDNLGWRTFNSVEKGRILWRLQQVFQYDTATLLAEFCPLLEVPPRADILHDYCALASLEESIQAAVVEGGLAIETALWLGAQEAVDRQALLTVFSGLKPGTNRARELATYIDEICQRDGCSVLTLLHKLAIMAVVNNAAMETPQKLERVRTLLRQTRYPHLSLYEQRFQEAYRRLHLPPQISLRPPPHFEGPQYQVTFGCRSWQELQQHAQRLLDAAPSEAMGELFKLL